MRLTDILKKQHSSPPPAKAPSPSEEPAASNFAEKDVPSISQQNRPPVFGKDTNKDNRKTGLFSGDLAGAPPLLPQDVPLFTEDIAEIYADAVKEARDIFGAVSASKKFHLPVSAGIIANLILEGRLDFLLFTNRTTADHYIYSHVVNVSAMASVVAVKMGFPTEEVKKISIAAFLHDVGMAGMLDMVSSKGRFKSPEEMSRIKQHPVLGQDIIEEYLDVADADLKGFICRTIAQTHERVGRQGYPKGLSAENIAESAMVIAVVDSYEAITHNRSYRDQLIPHEAIKTLINESEDNFNQEVMKAFLTGFSLYPVGSYVRLSNNQIGRILRINDNMPTRPVVRIVADQQGKRVADKTEIALEQTSVLSIKEAVDETKIKLEPKLSLELQTQRWWIR